MTTITTTKTPAAAGTATGSPARQRSLFGADGLSEEQLEALESDLDLYGLRAPGLNADPSASSDFSDAEEDALVGCEKARAFLISAVGRAPRLLSELLEPRGLRWRWTRNGGKERNRIDVTRGDRVVVASSTPRAAAIWAATLGKGERERVYGPAGGEA